MNDIDGIWDPSATRCENQVRAACYVVGAVGIYLGGDTGYTDAQRLEHIRVEISKLKAILGLDGGSDRA